MKILDHINTTLYTRNREAQEIWRITQPELDALFDEVHRIFDNTRVTLADMDGLEIWEDTYGILPDVIVDTDEERRDRVLEMKRTQPPFTERWMESVVARKFPEECVVVALYGLRLYVIFDVSYGGLNEKGFTRREYRELLRWFRSWLPTNVLLVSKALGVRAEIETQIYTAGRGFRVGKRAVAKFPSFGGVPRSGGVVTIGRGFRFGSRGALCAPV